MNVTIFRYEILFVSSQIWHFWRLIFRLAWLMVSMCWIKMLWLISNYVLFIIQIQRLFWRLWHYYHVVRIFRLRWILLALNLLAWIIIGVWIWLISAYFIKFIVVWSWIGLLDLYQVFVVLWHISQLIFLSNFMYQILLWLLLRLR